MTADMIVKSKDLKRSGPLVMALFAANYPNGLTIQQMLDSGIGWIVEAAKLLLEELEA